MKSCQASKPKVFWDPGIAIVLSFELRRNFLWHCEGVGKKVAPVGPIAYWERCSFFELFEKQIRVCFHQSQLQRAMRLWRIFHHMTSITNFLSDFCLRGSEMRPYKSRWTCSTSERRWCPMFDERSECLFAQNCFFPLFSCQCLLTRLSFPPHVNWAEDNLQWFAFLIPTCFWCVFESSDGVLLGQRIIRCLFLLQIGLCYLCLLFFIHVQQHVTEFYACDLWSCIIEKRMNCLC
jgi:hypothetical protein